MPYGRATTRPLFRPIRSAEVQKPPSLPDATWQGSAAIVRRLLESGASPNTRDAGGRTGLHYACRKGLTEAVFLLVEHGADVRLLDNDSSSALHEAVSAIKYDFEVVRLLLEHGADPNVVTKGGWTPLMLASLCGREEAVDLLLQKGADPNFFNNMNQSALDLSVERLSQCESYHRIVTSLLSRIDKPNMFHDAARSAKTAIVKLLLKDVDINAQDVDGKTALTRAAAQNANGVVRLLLDGGVDLEKRDAGGRTALIEAVVNGCYKSARLLLRRHADVNARDAYGRTALMYAAEAGTGHMVRLLLKYGADPNLADNSGNSSLALAMTNSRSNVRAMLS